MTIDEALSLKSYSHYCTCGGFARKGKHPHQNWCAQFAEYEEWIEALDKANMTPEQALKHIFPNLY